MSSRVNVTQRLVSISTNKNNHGRLSPPRSPKQAEDPSRIRTEFTRRSPLKFEEEESLVSAFREQIRHEKELEDAKIRLAAQPDFNLMDGY